MAEHKRIPFETVKPVNKDKKTSDLPPTARFNLPLHESNEKTCPEFSYGELVKTAGQDEKKAAESDEPFGEEDDQKLREIARKFEEKYGPKVSNKKRKRMGRWEDYIDRGMGYDETDPFIDNDEAYDELVPSTLTTQFGGFYINSGELEFRTISEAESDGPLDGVKRRRRRRRRDVDEKELKKRRVIGKDGSPSRGRGRKPGLDRSASALAKAKRKAQPTVASLLQERKAQLLHHHSQEMEQPKLQVVEIQEQQHPPPKEVRKEVIEEPLMMADSPLPAPVISSSEDEDLFPDLDQLAGSDDKSENNINDIIESVIRNSEDVLNNGNLLMYAGGGSSDGDEVALTIADAEIPKLPENLSIELNELVKKIKQAAISSEQGKCKFFTHDVNKVLLNIELKSRELSCTQRSMIYSHLASFLPCTKETLLKRAKKLRLDQEDGKLHEPMQRLRKGIAEVLPAMIEKFSAACLAVGENKFEGDELTAAGSDGEDSQGKEEKKGTKLPKKKFEWNDQIRELLCEVVRIKLKCYEVSKMRAQSAEVYLHQFLEQEVCKLWPVGWVNTKMLLKESRSAHAYVTSAKPNKKPLVVVKKLNASAPSQAEGIPQSPIVKYSNVPQTMLVQESQHLVENMVVPQPPMPPLEESEEELAAVKNIQAALVSEDWTAVASNKMNPTASAYLDTSTMEQQQPQVPVPSPSKRIFTLMNTEEAAQVVEAQKPTSQKSFAASMLDRIICASLADFPNSGTSTQSVTIERTSRPSKVESVQKQVQQEPAIKNEPMLLKASTTHLLQEATKTSSAIYGSTPAVSILKSNYQPAPQPQQTLQQQPALQQQTLQQQTLQQQTLQQQTLQQQTLQQQQQQALHQQQSRPNRVLEHVTPMSVSSSMSSKQVSPNSMSNPLVRPSHGSSLPMQTYEFQEAFKRSLSVSNNSGAGSGSELAAVRNYPRKRQVSEESDDQPVNFSNPQPSAHYVASQELNRLASSALGPSSFQSQPAISTTPVRVPRSSPETSYTSGFTEGMKGFPLPLKTVSNPPPAHSYPSNRRTSPSTESGFTSPHRHNNSQSPHQLASSAHSPPQSVSNHSPYQSTAPLSHFTTPDSAHNPRNIIQTGWRNNTVANSTTSASQGFSMPSQYSTASSSSNTSYNLSQSASGMNHSMSGLGPPPGHHFLPATAPTSGQRSHAKPYSSPSALQSAQQAQQAMQRGVYGQQMYATGTGYPGAVGGQFCETLFGQTSPQQLSTYHGVSLPSLAGPGQQGSHTRIP